MSMLAHVAIDDGQEMTCRSPAELAIHEGDQCVVENHRVMELGRIVKLEAAEDGPGLDGLPHVVRRATLQDQAKAAENAVMTRMAMKSCVACAKKLGLPLRFVRVRYTFDRAILMVLFSSEENVDCHGLIHQLESELHTRLDLRQIGVRDEAGLIGGVGTCGRALCCCSWLRRFESVNVKMAKIQNLSLNPGAISGNCGRLKCCLRYEHEVYKEIGRRLPRQGAIVSTSDGNGMVVGKETLSQRLRVRLEDGRMLSYHADEVKELPRTGHDDGDRRDADEDSSDERPEPPSARQTGTGDVRDRDAG